MKKNIVARIAVDIALAVSCIQGWWIAAAILAIVGMWRFPFFIEIIIAGAAYDMLFGFVPEMGIAGYISIIISVIAFTLSVFVKSRIRA